MSRVDREEIIIKIATILAKKLVRAVETLELVEIHRPDTIRKRLDRAPTDVEKLEF